MRELIFAILVFAEFFLRICRYFAITVIFLIRENLLFLKSSKGFFKIFFSRHSSSLDTETEAAYHNCLSYD